MKRIAIFFLTGLLLAGCGSSDNLKQTESTLRVAVDIDPSILDPRVGGAVRDQMFTRNLFEGLMRVNPKGQIVPGIAESYQLSEDGRTYTFHLRDSQWSNGDPLVAYDFEYAWKTLLSPDFVAPEAETLYLISNARAAKEGKVHVNQIGVKAIDDKTLVVELVNPAPYFLDLLSSGLYAPIPHNVDQLNPNWHTRAETFVGNGPFRLEKWKFNELVVFTKNPNYWDADTVNLARVEFSVVDNPDTAFKMYEQGEIDWAGEPFFKLSMDTLSNLTKTGRLQSQPIAGKFRYTFDVEAWPFHSKKIRQAFGRAVDRKALIDHLLQGGEMPLTSVVPPTLSLYGKKGLFADGDRKEARRLFDEGLEELGVSREEFGPIVLVYRMEGEQKALSQAIQQQWEETFDISIELEGHEPGCFVADYLGHTYPLAGITWVSDYNDPFYDLNVYSGRDNHLNAARWENEEYSSLVAQAQVEVDPKRRRELLAKAEAIIADEMPELPVYTLAYRYVKPNHVTGVYITGNGYTDLKWAEVR